MSDYLAFVYGGLPQPSGDALADGRELARQCLDQLRDLDSNKFPPRLLILLASPAYLEQQKAEQLLQGVQDAFNPPGEDPDRKDVELIGSSVGGVFFDRRIYPTGALLVCLASRLIEADVAYGKNARRNRKGAVKHLLNTLRLSKSDNIDPNPLANRLLLTFLPGCKEGTPKKCFYPAPELHRNLYEGVQARIWMIGGVSSANDMTRRTDGWQFAGREVMRDAVVAASIVTGVPIGVSLNDIFDDSDKVVLRATELDPKDRRTILKFNDLAAQEQLDLVAEGRPNTRAGLMLAKLSASDQRTVDIPMPKDGGAVQLLGPLNPGDYFQILRPGVGKDVVEAVWKGIEQARRKVYVRNPAASLLFPCKAYSPRGEGAIHSAEALLAEVEKRLDGKPCVGGFFDGELGVDETGRSRLTNGGVGYVVLGDEVRERTPLYKGVTALADHGPKLLAGFGKTTKSIYETIEHALNVIDQTGFPGAMISLVYSSLERQSGKVRDFLIEQPGVGLRFPHVATYKKRACDEEDVLVDVAQKGRPLFVPDSRKAGFCDSSTVKQSGIISQYLLPLRRSAEGTSTFGTLQVDVGNLRHLEDEDFRETEKARMLNCLAEVFSAALLSIANYLGNQIMLALDDALKESMRADTLGDGLSTFFEAAGAAFGAEMGELWLVKRDGADEDSDGEQTLVLETGFGECYKLEAERRREIRGGDDPSPIGCAVRADGPEMINDMEGDPAWQAVLDGVEPDSDLSERLGLTKSYATVAFKGTDGQTLGALSFGSTHPWHFLQLHKRAMIVLAARLAFLIEHLRARLQRDFLINVSPNMAKRYLDRTEENLQSVTDVFHKELKADAAALYLWDQDRKRYVLRAATGWHDKKWVHAASYPKNAGWIGARDEPLYEPDLRQYYIDHQYEYPSGRYSIHMFGKSLSDSFVVEAIALPLRIGVTKKDKLGVLTLYRKAERGRRSGFVVTDIPVLQEGAYNVAGLVSAVLRHRDVRWGQQEDARREKFYDAINTSEVIRSFERRVCHNVLDCFRAVRADFYQRSKVPGEAKLSWVAGSSRDPRTDAIKSLRRAAPDRLIEKAFETGTVTSSRKKVATGQEGDPVALKIEGLVDRACVPLVGAGKILGVLDVRWGLHPNKAFSIGVRHNSEKLLVLGQVTGSAYNRTQIAGEGEQSNLALQATAAYSVQRAHLLKNIIQHVYNRSRNVKKGVSDIDVVIPYIKEAMKVVKQTTVLGKRVLQPSCHRYSVTGLIKRAFEKQKNHLTITFEKLGIPIPPPISEDFMVRVDSSHTLDALFNLLDNAANAIERKQKRNRMSEPPSVTITVASADEGRTKLFIADNGIGMTEEERRDALRGFVHARDHKGVGVLISYVLLAAQGGSLKLESEKWVGTRAIVTLPSAVKE